MLALRIYCVQNVRIAPVHECNCTPNCLSPGVAGIPPTLMRRGKELLSTLTEGQHKLDHLSLSLLLQAAQRPMDSSDLARVTSTLSEARQAS